MTKYIVTGGTALKGKVTLHGAKNAGFKAMIAALLCDGVSEIENISLIGEIKTTTDVITCLGGKVSPCGGHCLKIDPTQLSSFDAPKSCGNKSRAGMMFVGPLLAKFGKAILPIPGGDKIGVRPIDRHLEGLESLGAKIELKNGLFHISTPNGLHGGKFRFRKNTHTGTETLIMAAVKAKGTTILENAAEEPEIDSLIEFLNKAGAKIKRSFSRTISIDGVDELKGVKHKVIGDRNVAVTFACAALVTGGEVVIEGIDSQLINAFLTKINEIGGGVEIKNDSVKFYSKGVLKATNIVAAPYPGFMTDWQAVWATLMTQAVGVSQIQETIFENRFGYVANLVSMGAKIELFNPKINNPEEFYNFNLKDDTPENFHAARIFGPTSLIGKNLTVNDVRMGSTTILAGLVAKGKTVISDPGDQIARGYEDLVGKFRNLGANIDIITE